MPTALALDSSVLSPFARARRLSLLEQLTDGYRRVVTRAVLEEVRRGEADHPGLADVRTLPWLEVVTEDSLRGLAVFNEYVRILGSDDRNIGEASILAWAELRGEIVLIDDQTAVNAARKRGVTVRRSLALVAGAYQSRALVGADARALVDDLVAGGARFPCDGASFERWAEENGLIIVAPDLGTKSS